MTKRVQIYGVATGTMSGLTGLSREVIVDTTKNTLVVHDGVTVGGHELAKKDATNIDVATDANAGAMSAADKTKLDSLVASGWTETATAATARAALGLGGAAAEALSANVVDNGSGSLATRETINAQTGTTYDIVSADRNKTITFANAGAIAATLPNANTLAAGWKTTVKVLATSVGSLTITPATSTIDGGATLVVAPGATIDIISDGTNYLSAYTVAAATKSQMQTGTNNSVVATPLRVLDSDGAVKVHGRADDGALQTGSFNIASCVKNATGNYTFTFTVPFASADYTVIATSRNGASGHLIAVSTQLAGSVVITDVNSADATAQNGSVSIACFGRQ